MEVTTQIIIWVIALTVIWIALLHVEQWKDTIWGTIYAIVVMLGIAAFILKLLIDFCIWSMK